MPSMWMTLQAKYTDNLFDKVVRLFLYWCPLNFFKTTEITYKYKRIEIISVMGLVRCYKSVSQRPIPVGAGGVVHKRTI